MLLGVEGAESCNKHKIGRIVYEISHLEQSCLALHGEGKQRGTWKVNRLYRQAGLGLDTTPQLTGQGNHTSLTHVDMQILHFKHTHVHPRRRAHMQGTERLCEINDIRVTSIKMCDSVQTVET